MSEKESKIKAENPEIFTGLKLSKPKKFAAGTPAVMSALKHVFSEMGISRGLKILSDLNQKGGIDCPSCAWPDPDDERSTMAEYCENGAKAIAEEATSKSLKPDFFAANSIQELSELSDFEIGKKGRIAQPMYLAPNSTHYAEISWKDAFLKIAEHLQNLHSPDEAVFYTSGRTSNEAAFLYQLFVREFGTNNLPDCSNMCHESSGVALGESIGIGKGSVKLEDFYEAEVILILGQNPGTNHPRMLSALQKAKKNGAKIISINPLKEAGLIAFANPQNILGLLGSVSDLTDIYLQVKINSDMALLKVIMHKLALLEDQAPGKVFDLEFIQQYTTGFDSFIKNIRNQDIQKLIDYSGVPEYQIDEVVKLISSSSKIIACWAMGLTQHKNAVETIQDVTNLLLLKGSIGKPGAGTCPVRGHSNVQGDRTMGIYEKPSSAFLDSLENIFNFKAPRKHGYDTVESIHAMKNGDAKVFICLGGNFLSATPDTAYTAKAIQNCNLTVQVSTKLNRSHLIHGNEALILPCLGRTDIDIQNNEAQFVSVENSMGVVHLSKGSVKPISEKLKSEPIIVSEIAKATFGNKSKVNWDYFMLHYDNIRNSIEACIPGFNQYNKRVRIPGGFYLPNGSRENNYPTITGKANFIVSSYEPIILKENEFIMMTIRSHDQFNTTIYGLDDRYRGIYGERRVILMNKIDINKLELLPGDVVDLFNYFETETRVARKFIVVEYDIPRYSVATYFPEANVLVPINSTAKRSNTPTSKSVIIEIRKAL
jgi:molybdopterin-dependent oxidoreductase alpha subunit